MPREITPEEQAIMDRMAAGRAPGAQVRLDQNAIQVRPVGGGVGTSDAGEVILAFDAMVALRIEVVLDDEATKSVQRGLATVRVGMRQAPAPAPAGPAK